MGRLKKNNSQLVSLSLINAIFGQTADYFYPLGLQIRIKMIAIDIDIDVDRYRKIDSCLARRSQMAHCQPPTIIIPAVKLYSTRVLPWGRVPRYRREHKEIKILRGGISRGGKVVIDAPSWLSSAHV